jgi:hypothetical protein
MASKTMGPLRGSGCTSLFFPEMRRVLLPGYVTPLLMGGTRRSTLFGRVVLCRLLL